LMLLLAGATAADKFAELNFLVLKDANGKPVRNASVVIHPIEGEGKQSKGGLQVKTDADGKAALHSIPYGKLRLQVLAPGYQTFGEDFVINQPSHEFTIKLKKPQEQFSIYK
jgi:Carboxypeptidase regulatory-like domain